MKTLALIAAAATMTASVASANIIDFDVKDEGVETLVLDSVSGPAGSMLSVYDYRFGAQGDLVGSLDLNSGFDSQARIQLDGPQNFDMLAVLTDGAGNVVDTHIVHVDNN